MSLEEILQAINIGLTILISILLTVVALFPGVRSAWAKAGLLLMVLGYIAEARGLYVGRVYRLAENALLLINIGIVFVLIGYLSRRRNRRTVKEQITGFGSFDELD